MPVKIRLTRMGKKKQPSYRVVVMDSRKARDSAYIEQIGFYDPRQEPSQVEINNEAALKWLRNGAQPTERARKLLEISGAWTQFKVAKGEIHVAEADATPAPVVHVIEDDAGDEPVADAAADEPAVEAAAPEAVAEEPVAAEASAETTEESTDDEDAS
jgi:small subunit ribosomal protein S16